MVFFSVVVYVLTHLLSSRYGFFCELPDFAVSFAFSSPWYYIDTHVYVGFFQFICVYLYLFHQRYSSMCCDVDALL